MLDIAETLRALSVELSSAANQMNGGNGPAVIIPESTQTSRKDQVLRAAVAILALRRRRGQYFPQEIFGEPCWDMLLDLFVARETKKDVSVSALCVAAQVPQATALRYITKLEQRGDLVRIPDTRDCRRTLVRLSDASADAMKSWLSAMLARMVVIR